VEEFLRLDERDAAICRGTHLSGEEGVKSGISFSAIPAGNILISEPQALTGRADTTGFFPKI
jgi:hypothetical protein